MTNEEELTDNEILLRLKDRSEEVSRNIQITRATIDLLRRRLEEVEEERKKNLKRRFEP